MTSSYCMIHRRYLWWLLPDEKREGWKERKREKVDQEPQKHTRSGKVFDCSCFDSCYRRNIRITSQLIYWLKFQVNFHTEFYWPMARKIKCPRMKMKEWRSEWPTLFVLSCFPFLFILFCTAKQVTHWTSAFFADWRTPNYTICHLVQLPIDWPKWESCKREEGYTSFILIW